MSRRLRSLAPVARRPRPDRDARRLWWRRRRRRRAGTTTDRRRRPSDSVTDLSLVPASPRASTPDVGAARPPRRPSSKVTPHHRGQRHAGRRRATSVVVDYVGVRQADGEQFDTQLRRRAARRHARRRPRHQGLGRTGSSASPRASGVQLDIPADLAYGDSPPGELVDPEGRRPVVRDRRAATSIPAPDPTQAAGRPPTCRRRRTTNGNDPRRRPDRRHRRRRSPPASNGVFLMVYFDRGDGRRSCRATWAATAPRWSPTEDGDPAASPASALAGMKVGGRRALTIPAAMAQSESDVVIVARPARHRLIR